MILNTTSQYSVENKKPAVYPLPDPKYFFPRYSPFTQKEYLFAPVIVAENPSPLGTGLEDLMGQRRDIIGARIGMIVSEIYQRHQLKETNLYGISADQCACRNLIYQMDERLWDKKRVELEKKIIDLEQEKRREKADNFRDILFLRKELRETMIEKLEEDQKARMFLNQKEDVPCSV